MKRALRYGIAALTGIAGWLTWVQAVKADDGSELSAGSLTGPMIAAAFVAALLLYVAALHSLFGGPQGGRKSTILGGLFACPWATWLLFPGMWCMVSNCSVVYPRFNPDSAGAAMIGLPALAIWLRRWA